MLLSKKVLTFNRESRFITSEHEPQYKAWVIVAYIKLVGAPCHIHHFDLAKELTHVVPILIN